MSESKKTMFLQYVKTAVLTLFYYDRKNCEELSIDDVEALINNGEISLREIIEAFQSEIILNYPDKFKDELEMAYMFRSQSPEWLPSMPPPPLSTLKEFT